jgi:serine/threonine protein kinase
MSEAAVALPECPCPSDNRQIEDAARAVPVTLLEMDNMPGVARGDRFRQVWRDHLIRRLEAKGYSGAVASWGIHRLVERGLLGADAVPGGYAPSPPNPLHGRVIKTGPPGRTNRGGPPAAGPSNGIRIWTTDALWRWDEKNRDSRRRKQGDRVADWTLEKRLGQGGNGEVWQAMRADGTRAALKILHANHQRADSDHFRRFRDEIQAQKLLSSVPGVLPIIDCSAPEQPSAENPAWLATPVAIPITKALGQRASLEAVVEAIAALAETLTLLHAKGCFHRDIKPDNLFRLEGKWQLGDFGLVDFPGKARVTAKGKRLGPMYFIAPEMLTAPLGADGGKADVFSLAKTLWVLATGQNFAPPGEQPAHYTSQTIQANISHPRAFLLDRLIEKATKTMPVERCSMAEMYAELRAWLAGPRPTAHLGEVSELAARIAAAAAPEQHKDRIRASQIQLADEARGLLTNQLRPLVQAIAATGLSDNQISHNEGPHQHFYTPQQLIGSPAIIHYHPMHIRARGRNANHGHVEFSCFVAVWLTEDGLLHIDGGYLVSVGFSYPATPWRLELAAPVGSAQQESAIADLVAGLSQNLGNALEVLLASLKWDGRMPLPGQSLPE